MSAFVAIDLGASSCRVVNVHVEPDGVRLDLVRRFPTPTRALSDDQPAWDVASLLDQLRVGLREATSRAEVGSVAIDAWGVDYGLLDHSGRMLGPVHAYRSSRTAGVMERLTAEVGRARIYDITGIQFLPFNTIYQLAARGRPPTTWPPAAS